MNNEETRNKSPAEKLAETISRELVEKKILLQGDAKKMTEMIATGKVKESEWRIAIEKSIDKESKDAKGSN